MFIKLPVQRHELARVYWRNRRVQESKGDEISLHSFRFHVLLNFCSLTLE